MFSVKNLFSSCSTPSKKNLNQKQKRKTNKNLNKQGTLQSAGGIFTIHPKIYTNIMYKKSGYTTPKLKCLQCGNGVFRRHNATHESKLRDFMLESDVLSKKYNIFVCYKCGFMMNYSGDISYNSVRSEKGSGNNNHSSGRKSGK